MSNFMHVNVFPNILEILLISKSSYSRMRLIQTYFILSNDVLICILVLSHDFTHHMTLSKSSLIPVSQCVMPFTEARPKLDTWVWVSRAGHCLAPVDPWINSIVRPLHCHPMPSPLYLPLKRRVSNPCAMKGL